MSMKAFSSKLSGKECKCYSTYKYSMSKDTITRAVTLIRQTSVREFFC